MNDTLSLEVAILPVSDPDRSLAFYRDRLGFALDVDYAPSDSFRVVQLTPPGSGVSIQFGRGLTETAPGVGPFYLVVTDIESARERLIGAGVDVGPVRHKAPFETWAGGMAEGVDPEHRDYASFADFRDPDGNIWTLQERGFHTPA